MNFLRSSRPLAFALFAFAAGACTSSPSTSGPSGSGGTKVTGTGGNQTGSGGSPGSGGSGGNVGSGGSIGSGGSGGSTPAMDANGGDSTSGGTGGMTGADSGAETATGACTYKFCEDFESETSGAPPNPARWSLDGTAPVVDGTTPHKGKQSLHVLPHTGGTCSDTETKCPAARFARLTDAFPQALHQQHYGRMFFYLNRTPTDLQYYHWMFMEVNASTRYAGGLALRQGGEMPAGGPLTNGVAKDYMLTHVDTHNKAINPFETERGRVQTQTPLNNKTWYCLEWFIDAPGQKARYWINGDPRTGLNWDGPIAGSPQFTLPAEFKSLAVGLRVFQVYPSAQQWEVFIDDIALDDKQIGCN